MQKNTTAIKDFFKSIDVNLDKEEWFIWPPDVFAITSLLLKRTGAYIFTIMPPEKWPSDIKWHDNLREAANQWHKWVLGIKGADPFFLKKVVSKINELSDITIEDVILLVEENSSAGNNENTKFDTKSVWDICEAVLTLHVLADEACAGFGIPGLDAPINGEESLWYSHQKSMYALANTLLTCTGSLSLLPTHQIRVLPKLTKPKVGLTLRSLSRNVTAHQTEIDVLWRTMPWNNFDENTINILIVPWPKNFKPTWFRPSNYTSNRSSAESARYFNFNIPDDEEYFPPNKLEDLLQISKQTVGRIRMVVFPELSLTKKNLEKLLKKLDLAQDRKDIPMVIAGIRGENSANNELGENSVVLSTFFTGKWYQMEQHKHHRWKLDEQQIQQYNIGSVLSGNRDWWESIKISRRQLSVLTPNNWLTLCPLICEDLARLEPVSEVIRGIGPTMLIALLLDGPQLKDRWPGRYASVMADDPGSSVLTVSALGFTKRSLPPQNIQENTTSHKIALWKDPIHGWEEITIKDNADAVVLTVAAHWGSKISTDGRIDDKSSATFVFQGVHSITSSFKGTVDDTGIDLMPVLSEHNDLLELSLFSFFVDALLDSNDKNIGTMKSWILGGAKKATSTIEGEIRPAQHLLERVRKEAQQVIYGYNKLEPFLRWITEFIEGVSDPDPKSGFPNMYDIQYEVLVDDIDAILNAIHQHNDQIASKLLKDENPFKNPTEYGLTLSLRVPYPEHEKKDLRLRVYIYGCLSILWAIHTRLSDLRRQYRLNNEGFKFLLRIENLLSKKYDKKWY